MFTNTVRRVKLRDKQGAEKERKPRFPCIFQGAGKKGDFYLASESALHENTALKALHDNVNYLCCHRYVQGMR